MSGKTAEELSKPKKYHAGDHISPVTTVFLLGKNILSTKPKGICCLAISRSSLSKRIWPKPCLLLHNLPCFTLYLFNSLTLKIKWVFLYQVNTWSIHQWLQASIIHMLNTPYLCSLHQAPVTVSIMNQASFTILRKQPFASASLKSKAWHCCRL